MPGRPASMHRPLAEVRFDARGTATHPAEIDDAVRSITAAAATDVLVLCHGWNSTPPDARDLYDRLSTSIDAVRGRTAGFEQRRLAVVGTIWPSLPGSSDATSALRPGSSDARLRTQIESIISDVETRRELLALVSQLDIDPTAIARFIEVVRRVLPAPDGGEDVGALQTLRTAPVPQVLAALRDDVGTEQGSLAASLAGAARNLLAVATYYVMRHRAGVVGAVGIAALLSRVHAALPEVRLHAIGHSFGGRAVTAAASAHRAPLSSLILLQAAYSHFGMARNWDGRGSDGLFAAVPARVSGPILVTYTRNDGALGLPYAIASRLANQVATALGDADDPYGAIGHNGALKTPASLPFSHLLEVGGRYAFAAGRVSSLNGDAFIAGHSDVTGPQVAHAIVSALAAQDHLARAR